MDWRHDSSGRVPVLQMQRPKFKPQFHQKEIRKEGKKERGNPRRTEGRKPFNDKYGHFLQRFAIASDWRQPPRASQGGYRCSEKSLDNQCGLIEKKLQNFCLFS
jgi:hypothetical protein